LRTMAVAEEAEVTDAMKSIRQHMDQEAADEPYASSRGLSR
jgi:hypothetical protein